MKNITEMLKGVLEGCVLEIISQKPTYGYEITQRLRELGFEDIVEGTVYTITSRLEKNKLVIVEKKPSLIGPPRKFYSLNQAGQARLEEFWESWNFIAEKCRELQMCGKGEQNDEFHSKSYRE